MPIVDPKSVLADYVLQVSVHHRPKSMNLLGSFHIWKKSAWFGNADELLKFCSEGGCKGTFSDTFTLPESALEAIGEDNIDDPSKWPAQYQRAYDNWFVSPVLCPICGNVAIREELPDTYGFNMPTARIATRMAEFFTVLQGSADVYLVRTKEDHVFQKARSMIGEAGFNFDKYKKTLELGRDRDCVFYSLKSIIGDTASGGDLALRFKALLEA